MDVLKDND